jgi:hypothetical protein
MHEIHNDFEAIFHKDAQPKLTILRWENNYVLHSGQSAFTY